MLKIHNNAKIKSAEIIRRDNDLKMLVRFIDDDAPSSDDFIITFDMITFDMFNENEVYRMNALFLYAKADTLSELTNKPIKICTSNCSFVVAIGDCYSDKFFFSDNRTRPFTELSEYDLYKYFHYEDTITVIKKRICEIESELDEKTRKHCPRSEIKKLKENIYALEAVRREFEDQLLLLSPN